MRRIFRFLLLTVVGLAILYWVGPQPADPVYNNELPVLSPIMKRALFGTMTP
jgi:hypothetical protein